MRDPGDRLYFEIRRAVLAMSRRTGRRPTAAEAIRELGLFRPDEHSAIDLLQREGLIQSDDRDGATGNVGSNVAADLLASLGGGLKRLLRRRDLSDAEIAAEYREAFSKRIRSERAGLAGHTTFFLGVNAVLTAIWAMTGAGFPWFLIPLMGWGIGYVSHRVSVRAREREYDEVTAAKEPTRQQLRLHRDLWKSRRRWYGHLASNGMTIALLATINVITGGFPWAVIPSGFLAVGIFTHRSRYRLRDHELFESLRSAGFRLPATVDTGRPGPFRRGNLPAGGPDTDPVRAARALKAEIVAVVKKYPEAESALGSDFVAALNRYVAQIETLDTTYREVAVLIDSIPAEALRQDRASTEERYATVTDERLRTEYQRNIQQIDRQIHSLDELEAEKEILRLRTRTALQALQQLKIDVTRARNTQSTAAVDTLADLEKRSTEISQYLDDLKSAWDEIS